MVMIGILLKILLVNGRVKFSLPHYQAPLKAANPPTLLA